MNYHHLHHHYSGQQCEACLISSLIPNYDNLLITICLIIFIIVFVALAICTAIDWFRNL